MTVLTERLELQVPVGARDGVATVRAYTVDDVGNRAVWTREVLIGEAPASPVTTPSGGLPGAAFRERPHLVELRTRLRIRTWTSTDAGIEPRTTITAASHTAVAVGRNATTEWPVVVTYWSATVAGRSNALRLASQTAVVARRNEGPGYEDELIVAGLL